MWELAFILVACQLLRFSGLNCLMKTLTTKKNYSPKLQASKLIFVKMPENDSIHPRMLNIQSHHININVWVFIQNTHTIILPSLGRNKKDHPCWIWGHLIFKNLKQYKPPKKNTWQDRKLNCDFRVAYTLGIGPTLLWEK